MLQTAQVNRNATVGIVILAAGASTRMRTPKQLPKIEGTSLIRRAAGHALDSGCCPVVVVLGANANLIAPELEGLLVNVTVNKEWQRGLSTSIRCGVNALMSAEPQIQAAMLMLADQPNVTGAALRKLNAAHVQTDSAIVAASYAGDLGTPALFSRSYFAELLCLDGEGGAKKLLQRYTDRVSPLDFPEAEFDLDTPKDVAAFANRKEVALTLNKAHVTTRGRAASGCLS